jgi:hypothetical protein
VGEVEEYLDRSVRAAEKAGGNRTGEMRQEF